MAQYLNNNDVLVLVAPQCTEEDRFAAAELQEALGDKTKVVLFTSSIYIDTLSVSDPYDYDGFPIGPITPPHNDESDNAQVNVGSDDNILNFPKTI